MKLNFTLLLVDDIPDSMDQAIKFLREHLDVKGFTLDTRIADELTEQSLQTLAQSDGRDYDLVMVDYNLGGGEITGADAARRLRQELPYTDIIFYSSDPSHNLFQSLANEEVQGVFVAVREHLSDALTGLADTVIRKAVDLNHMRGIVMAEVAEMDVIMGEALQRTFETVGNVCLDRVKSKTIERLRDSIRGEQDKLGEHLEKGSVVDLVRDSQIFSSARKYHAVRRAVKCLPDKPLAELDQLLSYEVDIIHKRNMLAHVKEDNTASGQTILRSIKMSGDTTIIDDDWMETFRRDLRTHRSALTTVCRALKNHSGAVEAVRKSIES